MAIQIPQGYAQGYRQAGQAQTDRQLQAAQGIASQFKTNEEKFRVELDNDIKDSMAPFTQAFGQDVSTWGDINFSEVKDAGAAYFAFKDRLKGRARRFADRNDLMDPIKFKAAYDERLSMMLPTLEQKLVSYQLMNDVSPKNMKKYIADNPSLQRILINSTNPTIVDWATPDVASGILPGLAADIPAIGGQAIPQLIRGAYRGQQAFRGAPAGKGLQAGGKGFLRGATPFRDFSDTMTRSAKGKEFKALKVRDPKTGQRILLDSNTKVGKISIGLQKRASRKAENVLKEAQSKYDKARDAYDFKTKGKKKVRIKGKNFYATKNAKTMRTAIETAKKGVKASYKKGTTKKIAGNVVKSYIKKHGVSGLIKEVARKAGWKTAARLAGQFGLGSMGVASGIGAAAGVALDLWTVWEIAKIIGTTVYEESGGFQAPGKMLLGGGEGQMPGKTY